jgi:hypothetical protein
MAIDKNLTRGEREGTEREVFDRASEPPPPHPAEADWRRPIPPRGQRDAKGEPGLVLRWLRDQPEHVHGAGSRAESA